MEVFDKTFQVKEWKGEKRGRFSDEDNDEKEVWMETTRGGWKGRIRKADRERERRKWLAGWLDE